MIFENFNFFNFKKKIFIETSLGYKSNKSAGNYRFK